MGGELSPRSLLPAVLWALTSGMATVRAHTAQSPGGDDKYLRNTHLFQTFGVVKVRVEA